MSDIHAFLLLSAAMFSIGVFGVLTRRNAVGILLAVELMANAVNINLVAFGRLHGGPTGQIFALFAIALTVAEVALGLALVLLLARTQRTADVDEARQLRG